MPTTQNIILYLFLFFTAEKSIASKAKLNENHIKIPEPLSLKGLNWAIVTPIIKIIILNVHKIDTLYLFIVLNKMNFPPFSSLFRHILLMRITLLYRPALSNPSQDATVFCLPCYITSRVCNVPEPDFRALLLGGACHPVKGCGAASFMLALQRPASWTSYPAPLCRSIVMRCTVTRKAQPDSRLGTLEIRPSFQPMYSAFQEYV